MILISGKSRPGLLMRLKRYSDYAMRVLLYLAARNGKLCSISEIAMAYGISQNHLMKVMQDLARAGYVASARGRSGGFRLAREPSLINVGAVLRHTEENICLVDCPNCPLGGACGLSPLLGEAMSAFFAVLDRHSLADLVDRQTDFRRRIASLETSQRSAP